MVPYELDPPDALEQWVSSDRPTPEVVLAVSRFVWQLMHDHKTVPGDGVWGVGSDAFRYASVPGARAIVVWFVDTDASAIRLNGVITEPHDD